MSTLPFPLATGAREQVVVSAGPSLPRLLYIGDVPVEASYHGSLLLFRLLESYTKETLTIVETASESHASLRLPGVDYRCVPLGSRWLNTRFHPMVMAWSTLQATQPHKAVLELFSTKHFDAILTVAHGLGWLVAAAIAQRVNVPLHLIVHDDWPRAANVPAQFRSWLDRKFARVYEQASSRMCVSPFMRTYYLEKYGTDGDVLYPCRSKTCPEFSAPPAHISRNDHRFTIAFAGTINSDGYVRALQSLRESLTAVNGRLLIFGPITKQHAHERGLSDANVELGGLLPSEVLIERLRNEADALFVPMSFAQPDHFNMEMAFPSKLADYTATGLPLLIYGPEYCSAIRWANENNGVAEVVASENPMLLTQAVQRLSDAPTRVALGKRALELGQSYFGYDSAQRKFQNALGFVSAGC